MHLPLLLLADEPEPLRGYLQLSDLYVPHAGNGQPLAVTHGLPHRDLVWFDQEPC